MMGKSLPDTKNVYLNAIDKFSPPIDPPRRSKQDNKSIHKGFSFSWIPG